MGWSNTTGAVTGAGASNGPGEIYQSGSSSTLTTGSSRTEYDPNTQNAINQLVNTLLSGGTANQRAELAKRSQSAGVIDELLQAVSKENAFNDAEGLMAQEMRKTLEKENPALRKAVQGAGTSAASMQGLLANDIAARAAEASAAQGALQERAYATERSRLAGIMESFTKPQNLVEDSLIRLLTGVRQNNVQENRTESNQTQFAEGRGGSGSRAGGAAGGSGAAGGAARGAEGGLIRAVPNTFDTDVFGNPYQNHEDNTYGSGSTFLPTGTGLDFQPGELYSDMLITNNLPDYDYGGPSWDAPGGYDPGPYEVSDDEIQP